MARLGEIVDAVTAALSCRVQMGLVSSTSGPYDVLDPTSLIRRKITRIVRTPSSSVRIGFAAHGIGFDMQTRGEKNLLDKSSLSSTSI